MEKKTTSKASIIQHAILAAVQIIIFGQRIAELKPEIKGLPRPAAATAMLLITNKKRLSA